MNTELITLVLSLLGDIPVSGKVPVDPQPPALYATWKTSRNVYFSCPDLSQGIPADGVGMKVTRTVPMPDGSHIAVTMPVTVYPDSKSCQMHTIEPHWKIFPTKGDADDFRTDCQKNELCDEWAERPATDEEIVQYALEKRDWKIDHIPGGNDYSYPDGVYEVWMKHESQYSKALGTGTSRLRAVADALKGERP